MKFRNILKILTITMATTLAMDTIVLATKKTFTFNILVPRKVKVDLAARDYSLKNYIDLPARVVKVTVDDTSLYHDLGGLCSKTIDNEFGEGTDIYSQTSSAP